MSWDRIADSDDDARALDDLAAATALSRPMPHRDLMRSYDFGPCVVVWNPGDGQARAVFPDGAECSLQAGGSSVSERAFLPPAIPRLALALASVGMQREHGQLVHNHVEPERRTAWVPSRVSLLLWCRAHGLPDDTQECQAEEHQARLLMTAWLENPDPGDP